LEAGWFILQQELSPKAYRLKMVQNCNDLALDDITLEHVDQLFRLWWKNNSSTSLSICDNDAATYMNGNSGEHRSTSILLINGKLAR
jgi:hypothetical protein